MAEEAKEKEAAKKTKRPSAQKREMQDKKRRLVNRAFRAECRSAIRHLREGIQAGNKEQQKAALSNVYSLLDKGVKKSIFKKNKANRLKARLTAFVRAQA